MPDLTPEHRARQQIDAQLAACSWAAYRKNNYNLSASRCVATGEPDYTADGKALCKLAEQTRIVAEVDRRLSVVEELESVVSANLQRAVRLRQSILQKAFTGELI